MEPNRLKFHQVTLFKIFLIVGIPVGKKTFIFTFDGKIEYIILPMLILFLDMWQNTYGWMPSL